jgi:hypothetical protein
MEVAKGQKDLEVEAPHSDLYVAIRDAFERLAIGVEVIFVAEEGDNGPQASTVRLVGGQHPAPAPRESNHVA